MAVLRDKTDAPLDWDSLRDPAKHIGQAEKLVERILAQIESD